MPVKYPQKTDYAAAPPHPSLRLGFNAEGNSGSDAERIASARQVVARLIADGMEELLPLFLRLENTFEEQKSYDNALERAIVIAKSE